MNVLARPVAMIRTFDAEKYSARLYVMSAHDEQSLSLTQLYYIHFYCIPCNGLVKLVDTSDVVHDKLPGLTVVNCHIRCGTTMLH